jgi:hypothetical protein
MRAEVGIERSNGLGIEIVRPYWKKLVPKGTGETKSEPARATEQVNEVVVLRFMPPLGHFAPATSLLVQYQIVPKELQERILQLGPPTKAASGLSDKAS